MCRAFESFQGSHLKGFLHILRAEHSKCVFNARKEVRQLGEQSSLVKWSVQQSLPDAGQWISPSVLLGASVCRHVKHCADCFTFTCTSTYTTCLNIKTSPLFVLVVALTRKKVLLAAFRSREMRRCVVGWKQERRAPLMWRESVATRNNWIPHNTAVKTWNWIFVSIR
jgi:hypothetical protein